MKIKYLILLLVSLSFFSHSFAQTIPPLVPVSGTPPKDFKELEQVMVTNVSLDSSSAKAGDTVTGKITLFSTYSQTLPGVSLRASLVSGLKDLNYDSLLDRKMVVTDIALQSHQLTVVPFSYILPSSGIVDHNGIYVEAITSGGDIIGFNATPIKVNNFLEYAQIKSAFIYVNKDKFALQMGPMIGESDDAHLTLSFIPPKTINTSLHPHVSLYDFEPIGTPLKDYVLPDIILKGKGVQDLTLPLELFNGKAGVYAGEIYLEDASGAKKSQIIDFRYIVKGNIATIRTITTDKQSGGKGDTINVNFEALGAPSDIVTGKTSDMGKVTLTLSLTNTQNQEVAHYTQDITFSGQAPFISTFPLVLTGPADTLTLHATLVDNKGALLDEKTINLSGNTKGNFEQKQNPFDLVSIVVGVILIFVIVLMIFVLGKFVILKVNNKKHE